MLDLRDPGRGSQLTQLPCWISHLTASPGMGFPGQDGVLLCVCETSAPDAGSSGLRCSHSAPWACLAHRQHCRSHPVPPLQDITLSCRLPFVSFPSPCCMASGTLLNSLSLRVCKIGVSSLEGCFGIRSTVCLSKW